MTAKLNLTTRGGGGTVPITPLDKAGLKAWKKSQEQSVLEWVEALKFVAKPGQHCLIPGDQGTLSRVLLGVDSGEGNLWTYAGLPRQLPRGRYVIDAELDRRAADHAALGWALGGYAFSRYKKSKFTSPTLVWPKAAERAWVSETAEAIFLVRDLINTPAADMGPKELADAAGALARKHKAKLSVIEGSELIKKNFPAIHAVGRASTRAPRLIDMSWGKKGPKVTIIGKGVCFDSGGLDLKPASGMKLMKKDMGGAAHALGLASIIMGLKLGVRLRVLVPAVENAVSGDAFRPLDVLQTRKGLTVEVGNTDAEGRLVLCDALAEADAEGPDLVIDFATLTGAARVALGTDLPAMFSNDDTVAEKLLELSALEEDPMWRLPIWKGYRKQIDSKVADLNNIASGPYAGAIIAALFLNEFVSPKTPWVHMDLMAWNLSARPGRPEGGEAMGLRAAAALVAALAHSKPKTGDKKD